jgi:MFS transporter, OPA family, sugar phosphate sensor protein UhpC
VNESSLVLTVTQEKKFRYWRLRIFFSIYYGYVFFYFTRKAFAFAMPAISKDLGFDKADLGLIGTMLAVSYGVSKLVSGIIADRSDARLFMSVGLFITAVLNIFFASSSSLYLFAILWGLNGWFQGFGWPPCARLLAHWYSQSERGTWWALWSTSHNVGGALIAILASWCTQYLGWRYAFYIPGAISAVAACSLFLTLRDTPSSLGLPPVEVYRKEGEAIEAAKLKKELSFKEILWSYVIKNPYIWFLSLASFFVYVIRTGVNDWTVLYLTEVYHMSQVEAGSTVFWFEMGGLFGMVVAGFISDKLFRGKRGPINLIFMLLVAVPIFAIWNMFGTNLIVLSIYMFALGFFLFGPQMLIGCAAVELSHKNAAATASGFAGLFAYVFGAAFAGYPLGKTIDVFGWRGFFMVLIASVICGAICFLPLLNVRQKAEV